MTDRDQKLVDALVAVATWNVGGEHRGVSQLAADAADCIRRLSLELDAARQRVEGLAQRVADQSELLARRAEKTTKQQRIDEVLDEECGA